MDYKKRKVKKIKMPKSPSRPKSQKAEAPKSQAKITQIKMEKKPSRLNKDIERAPANVSKSKPVFKKIEGGSTDKKRKTGSLKAAVASVAVLLLIVIFHFATPTGLYDYIQNAFSSWGGADALPQEVPGNKAAGVYANGNIMYALTDTTMYAYNVNGKQITSVQHGYMSPCVVTTSQRTLLYDRGNTGIRIDSLYANYFNKNLDNRIYTADLSESGRLAVVTAKEKYASELTVYTKNYSKVLMKYSSANDYISCVKLSANGKYVAFSAISVNKGTYHSVIKILNIASKEVIKEIKTDNIMIVKMASTSSGIFAQGSDKLITLDWDGENFEEYDYGDMTYFIENDHDCITVAYHPSGDARQTTVTTFDSKAEECLSITVDGAISGICSSDDYIYVLIDNTVYKYNRQSEITDRFTTGYQYNFIAAYKKGIVCFSDMKINYLK